MTSAVSVAGGYKQMSATANVSPNPANLLGIFVSAASGSPSIVGRHGLASVVGRTAAASLTVASLATTVGRVPCSTLTR